MLTVLTSAFLSNSCSPNEGVSGISEGTIHFDLSYPYYEGFLADYLPSEMQMTFKENNVLTDLSASSVFSTQFCADGNGKSLQHTLKFMQTKSQVHHTDESMQTMLDLLPQFTIIETDEVDSVAGFLCKKALATFDKPDYPDMEIYYTDQIQISEPNWFNLFHELDGVLLAYETEQFGLRTRYRATLVEEAIVDDAVFDIGDGYTEVSPEEMHLKLANLFSNLF